MVRQLFSMNNPDFNEAIIRVIPLIQMNFSKICDVIDNIPEKYNDILICSKNRAEFYKKSMEIRFEELMRPAYEKVINEIKEHEIDDFER